MSEAVLNIPESFIVVDSQSGHKPSPLNVADTRTVLRTLRLGDGFSPDDFEGLTILYQHIEVLKKKDQSEVYRVAFVRGQDLEKDTSNAVLSLIARHDQVATLAHEASAYYKQLRDLQGEFIPRMLGYFTGDNVAVMVLEDCGDSVPNYKPLSEFPIYFW